MRKKASRGLTLIEFIMVISIMAVLFTLSAGYIREVINLWNYVSFQTEIVSQARLAMMRMAREIRQINNLTSVYYADASRLVFNDTDGNRIEYSRTGKDLRRNTNILAQGVDSFSFVYYDNASQAVAAPQVSPLKTDIASVNVTLGLSAGGQKKSFYMRVFPRNLGG
ncbi:MAG: type II secretion system protein J [Deltaproteobacteria bacterium]